ncbi:MAG TPA: hypothetical protein VET87_18690 [Rubrivivax sp.]|nr:hypothetical protein [Rubrivivax sp.]
MIKRLFTYLVAAATALALTACATPSTRLDAQWVNPQYAGQRTVRHVMVMSAVPDSTNRRIFEDRMVAALSAAGLKAVQSYKFIPEEGPVAEDRLRRAVAEAGVTHAMVTRIINVSTQVNVSPGMVMGPGWGPGWGWGGGWGPGWGGFAGYHNAMWASSIPPQVTTTQNVHADTRVFDASDANVLWSAATTTSTSYNSVPQLIDQFVQLIVATMTQDGVI